MARTTQQRALMRAGLVVGMLSGFIAAADAPSAPGGSLIEGNLFTVGHRESAGGQLRGCGIEFGAIQRDFATRKGDPVFVAGSFYVQRLDAQALHYSLKLGTFEQTRMDKGVAPAHAFVRAPSGVALPSIARVQGDNPAYAIFVGQMDAEALTVLRQIADARTLAVGFNRQAGGMDVVVEVDLSVIDVTVDRGKVRRQTSVVPVNNFLACLKDLKVPATR